MKVVTTSVEVNLQGSIKALLLGRAHHPLALNSWCFQLSTNYYKSARSTGWRFTALDNASLDMLNNNTSGTWGRGSQPTPTSVRPFAAQKGHKAGESTGNEAKTV